MNEVSRRKVAAARPARQETAPAQRVGLLVAGMHRSGTSATTRILSLLGAQLPGNLMPAHPEYNASGFWESLDVVALNERLLAAAHSSWDDVLPIDPAQLPAGDLAAFRAGAREILARDFGEGEWFVLKDPRIGRLLAVWLQAVRDTGARPLVVLPVRHPLEVAASLQRREGFSEEKSLYMWLRHMLDVIRASRGVPRAVMVYDELMADWRACVQRLAADLDIQWPRRLEEIAAEADGFLDRGLRHHVAAAAQPLPGPLGHSAARLYDALCARAPGLDALADAIHAELAPTEALMAPLLRDAVRRVAAAQESLSSERERSERLSAAHDEKAKHVGVLTSEVTQLQEQRDRGVARIAELEGVVDAQRAAHAQRELAFADKQRHVEALMAEVEHLKQQRDRGLLRIRELEPLLEAERAAHAQLEDAFADKQKHVEVLAAEIRQLQAQRDRGIARIRELEMELKDMQEQRDRGIARIGDIETELNDMLKQRDRGIARIRELEADIQLHQEMLLEARTALGRINGVLS